jgi:hypothetical protein
MAEPTGTMMLTLFWRQERQTMNEERAQILEMLVAGRVTVEQAEQLLKAVDDRSPSASGGATSRATAQRRGDEPTDNFFAGLTDAQLAALRDSDVSTAFVEQMLAARWNAWSVEDLIELHDEGVTPRFVLDLQEAGLADLTRDQLIELYCHGVDATYVRELQALGLAGATPDQLVEMYDHGVDAAFVRKMQRLGYFDLTPSKWVALRDNGIEGDEPAEQEAWE